VAFRGVTVCSPAVVDQVSDEIYFPIFWVFVSSKFVLESAWLCRIRRGYVVLGEDMSY
jgi:hypothetical protein